MMNRKIFGEHLIKILEKEGIDAKKCNYIIYPIVEEGKKYNSKDDFIRLNVFPCDKISDYIFTFEEILQRFSVLEPYYPLWINIHVREDNIIELHTSLRFRRPSEVLKNNTGTEPFRVMAD